MPSTLRNFEIFPDLVHGQFIETLRRRVNIFNAASNNAIQLVSGSSIGFRSEESFRTYQSAVGRRDHTSNDDIPVNKVQGDKWVRPKVFRWVALEDETLRNWLQGRDMDGAALSREMGQHFATETMKDRADTTIAALMGAMQSESDMLVDLGGQSPSVTIDHKRINQALRKMGDRRNEIALLVTTSNGWADLIDHEIENKLQGVSDMTIREGTAATLGIPTLVINNDALEDPQSPGTDQYFWAALRTGAVVINDLETPTFETDKDIKKHNQEFIVRGDLTYEIQIAGFSWDDGDNPDDTALETTANWNYQMDKTVNGVKDGPGVLLKVDEA